MKETEAKMRRTEVRETKTTALPKIRQVRAGPRFQLLL